MINKEELQQFLDKHIAVGVDSYDINIPGLFFYFGYLKTIDSTEIKIETNNGFKIIQLNDIRDMHEHQEKKYND